MDAHDWEKLGIIGTLVLSGGSIVKWLLSERKELIASLIACQDRERQLRDKRADELLAQAKVLADSSEVVRDALADVTRSMEALERAVVGGEGSRK